MKGIVMKPWEVIKALELESSRNAKEQILFDNITSDFVSGIHSCYNYNFVYGIKKIPESIATETQDVYRYTFYDLLDKLHKRELTGNAAIAEVTKFASNIEANEWNYWFRRILLRDMKCGATLTTFNKVLEKKKYLTVPEFSCQLAYDIQKKPKQAVGRKILQPKMDGVRVITIVNADSKTVRQFTRNGKELVNFPKICKSFEKLFNHVQNFPSSSLVFDGEIMSDKFQALMSQLNRKEDVQTDDAVLFVFDVIDGSDFYEGKSSLNQLHRMSFLNDVFNSVNFDKCIQPVPHVIVEDINSPETEEYFQIQVEAGFEGIMIKDPEAPYECKRTPNWLKMKPSEDETAEIIDYEIGTGKNASRLGALVVQFNSDGKLVKTNVGIGFKDHERELFWQKRGNLKGMMVDISYDAITQNKNGEYSTRFSRFKKIRGFKPGEKI